MPIEIFIGPMFSGKTTRLIESIERRMLANKKCLVVRQTRDNRHDVDVLMSHRGVSISGAADIKVVNNLCDLGDIVANYDTIGIDEGQFFDDLRQFCILWRQKHIYISGLNGDYKQEPFQSITEVLPLVTSISFLRAVCACGEDASFSKLKVVTEHLNHIIPGGKNEYYVTCEKCL